MLRVSRMHAGVDFAVASGTPIYATGDGTVRFVGDKGGYGNVVEVDHPLAGKTTRYAHLTTAAPGIREGAPVRRGQTIAYSGHTGLSTAPAPALRGPPPRRRPHADQPGRDVRAPA